MFFKLDDFCPIDEETTCEFPKEEKVIWKMWVHGFNVNDLIVLYGQLAQSLGPYIVHLVLRAYGFTKVYVLRGGLETWKLSYEVFNGWNYEESMFTPSSIAFNTSLFIDMKILKS